MFVRTLSSSTVLDWFLWQGYVLKACVHADVLRLFWDKLDEKRPGRFFFIKGKNVCLSVTNVNLSVTFLLLHTHRVYVCLSVTNVCLSVTNVCLSVTNVCLSVTFLLLHTHRVKVCLSITNVCLSVTHVCLSVTHTDQYHSLPRLWRKFGKEAGWTNKQEKSLFGHLHPRRASNGRRRRPICECL